MISVCVYENKAYPGFMLFTQKGDIELAIEQVCGPCSIDEEFSKEKRIELACLIKKDTEYSCPNCKVYFIFTGSIYLKSTETFTIATHENIEQPTLKAKNEDQDKDPIQLSLF